MAQNTVSSDANEVAEFINKHQKITEAGELQVTRSEKNEVQISYKYYDDKVASMSVTGQALKEYIRGEEIKGREWPETLAPLVKVANEIPYMVKEPLKHSTVDSNNFVTLVEGTKYDNFSLRADEAIGAMVEAHGKVVSVRAAGKDGTGTSDTSFTITTPEAIEKGNYPKAVKEMARKLAKEAENVNIYPGSWDVAQTPNNPMRIVIQNERGANGKEEAVRMFAGKYDHDNHVNTSRGYSDTILLSHTSNMRHAVPGVQQIPHIENGIEGVIPFNLGASYSEKKVDPKKAEL